MIDLANKNVKLLKPNDLKKAAMLIASNTVKIMVFGATNSGKSTFLK